MAIILEGPDAAGKTTLGQKLQDNGFDLIMSGGAPQNETELLEYCNMQLAHCGRRQAALDRISPISHPIYNPFYRGSKMIKEWLDRMINHRDTLIVYCRPPNEVMMRPEKHQWKDYDSDEHKQKILDGQMQFIQLYDDFFDKVPNVQYDYTDNTSSLTLIELLIQSRTDDSVLASLQRLARPYQVSV